MTCCRILNSHEISGETLASHMDPPVSSFWAKLDHDDGGNLVGWHPLIDHCADVAACFETLLAQRIIQLRLAQIGGLEELGSVRIHRLCVLAGLHDAGKYNIGFQNRRLSHPPFVAGHVKDVLALYKSASAGETAERFAAALGVEEMEGWTSDPQTLHRFLITSFAHHGRPVEVGLGHKPWIWKKSDGLDPFEGLRELRSRLTEWFPEAFRNDARASNPLPDQPAFQHAYNGLLTLSDWLGSDERFFRYTRTDDPKRIEWARDRAKDAVRRIGLDASGARASLGPSGPAFEEVWPFTPHDAQRRLQHLPVRSGGGMTILEAPTGSGKTEAALIRFLRLFQAGEVDGLYFALPTRTSATQMHGRVLDAVRRVFDEESSQPPVTLAVPGYIRADDVEGKALPSFRVTWPDDERERWRFRGWAAERPKRYLAGCIVVGTVDQVLLSSLAVRHSHLRASALIRHLLVVDEVHASDTYMSRLLEEVVSRQLSAGGHVLLMSATLGSVARDRYMGLARTEAQRSLSPSTLDEGRNFPYPVLVDISRCGEEAVQPLSAPGPDRGISILVRPRAADAAGIAAHALQAAGAGARVLVIRNTVRDCLRLQRAIENAAEGTGGGDLLFRCGGALAPHHSRFTRPDRRALDHSLERAFGRRALSEGRMVVATQTVQQSLDIDADYLITDLCPMDVLVQRLGRLHRHDRDVRPPGYETPRAMVLVPEGRDLGKHIRERGEARGRAFGPHGHGTVYEDLRVLEATWRLLEARDVLELPRLSRELVEMATHPEALTDIAQELGGSWLQHGQTMIGIRQAHGQLARLNLADWTVPFDDRRCLFPDRPDQRIQTRLGEGDRRAELVSRVTGPFGHYWTEVTIPAHLAKGVPTDAEAQLIDQANGRTRFRFGAREFVYDRLGLRRTDGDDETE